MRHLLLLALAVTTPLAAQAPARSEHDRLFALSHRSDEDALRPPDPPPDPAPRPIRGEGTRRPLRRRTRRSN